MKTTVHAATSQPQDYNRSPRVSRHAVDVCHSRWQANACHLNHSLVEGYMHQLQSSLVCYIAGWALIGPGTVVIGAVGLKQQWSGAEINFGRIHVAVIGIALLLAS